MPASTSPEPAVASAAGPGLGRIACSTPTHPVAVPFVTMVSSEPPSAQMILRAISSCEASESGGVSSLPTSLPSSRRCGVSTSGAVLLSSSGNSGRAPEVRREMQLRPSASTTSGMSAESSAETAETVPDVTRMPGPTSVVEFSRARRTTSLRASLEMMPSESAGSPTTGISIRWLCTTGTIVSGTARVT